MQQQMSGSLGGCAQIKEGIKTLLDFNIHFWNILYRLINVFTVFNLKNTLPQIPAMLFELFLALQNVQKAKPAKCISTARALYPSLMY